MFRCQSVCFPFSLFSSCLPFLFSFLKNCFQDTRVYCQLVWGWGAGAGHLSGAGLRRETLLPAPWTFYLLHLLRSHEELQTLVQGRKKRAGGSNPMPLKTKQMKNMILIVLFHCGFGKPNQNVTVSKFTEKAWQHCWRCLSIVSGPLIIFWSRALTLNILQEIRVCQHKPVKGMDSFSDNPGMLRHA